jgi:hypothetical protein
MRWLGGINDSFYIQYSHNSRNIQACFGPLRRFRQAGRDAGRPESSIVEKPSSPIAFNFQLPILMASPLSGLSVNIDTKMVVRNRGNILGVFVTVRRFKVQASRWLPKRPV